MLLLNNKKHRFDEEKNHLKLISTILFIGVLFFSHILMAANKVDFKGPYLGVNIGYRNACWNLTWKDENPATPVQHFSANSANVVGDLLLGYNFRINHLIFGPRFYYQINSLTEKTQTSSENTSSYWNREYQADNTYGFQWQFGLLIKKNILVSVLSGVEHNTYIHKLNYFKNTYSQVFTTTKNQFSAWSPTLGVIAEIHLYKRFNLILQYQYTWSADQMFHDIDGNGPASANPYPASRKLEGNASTYSFGVLYYF